MYRLPLIQYHSLFIASTIRELHVLLLLNNLILFFLSQFVRPSLPWHNTIYIVRWILALILNILPAAVKAERNFSLSIILLSVKWDFIMKFRISRASRLNYLWEAIFWAVVYIFFSSMYFWFDKRYAWQHLLDMLLVEKECPVRHCQIFYCVDTLKPNPKIPTLVNTWVPLKRTKYISMLLKYQITEASYPKLAWNK